MAGRTGSHRQSRQSLHGQHHHDDPDPRRPRVAARRAELRGRRRRAHRCTRSTDAGGRITEAEPAPDGGGWARGVDDQGLPLLVYRPGGYHAHAAPTRAPSGELGLVFIRADAPKAAAFYGEVLGWTLTAAHPGQSLLRRGAGCRRLRRGRRVRSAGRAVGDAVLQRRRLAAGVAQDRSARRPRRRPRAGHGPVLHRRCAPTIRARRSASCRPRSSDASWAATAVSGGRHRSARPVRA